MRWSLENVCIYGECNFNQIFFLYFTILLLSSNGYGEDSLSGSFFERVINWAPALIMIKFHLDFFQTSFVRFFISICLIVFHHQQKREVEFMGKLFFHTHTHRQVVGQTVLNLLFLTLYSPLIPLSNRGTLVNYYHHRKTHLIWDLQKIRDTFFGAFSKSKKVFVALCRITWMSPYSLCDFKVCCQTELKLKLLSLLSSF